MLNIKFPPTHSPGWGNIKYLRVLCGCEYKSAALRTSSSPPQWLAGVRGAFLLYILAAAHAWLVPGHLHACICWYGDATSVCSPPQSRGWASASGHSALRHDECAQRVKDSRCQWLREKVGHLSLRSDVGEPNALRILHLLAQEGDLSRHISHAFRGGAPRPPSGAGGLHRRRVPTFCRPLKSPPGDVCSIYL